jgi:FkbM family methyltransferase
VHRITYWSNRLYVSLFVFTKNLFRNPWKLVEGVYLPLTPDTGFNTLRWIVNGKYEQGEIYIIKEKLANDDVVLEIGTGLGFISAYCCSIVGSANVYSFEANPLNVEVALCVYAKNNVEPQLQNALLADKKGFVDFPVNRKSRLASSLLKTSDEIVKVPQFSLNETIAALKPDFLIMDIEGAEYDIFQLIDFQTIRKIQVELHPAILGEVKMSKIFELLKQNGFQIGIALPDGRNYYFYKQ